MQPIEIDIHLHPSTDNVPDYFRYVDRAYILNKNPFRETLCLMASLIAFLLGWFDIIFANYFDNFTFGYIVTTLTYYSFSLAVMFVITLGKNWQMFNLLMLDQIFVANAVLWLIFIGPFNFLWYQNCLKLNLTLYVWINILYSVSSIVLFILLLIVKIVELFHRKLCPRIRSKN